MALKDIVAKTVKPPSGNTGVQVTGENWLTDVQVLTQRLNLKGLKLIRAVEAHFVKVAHGFLWDSVGTE